LSAGLNCKVPKKTQPNSLLEETAKRAAQTAAQLLAAAAVPESHHDGWVYCVDDRGPQDGFFESCNALREWCFDHDQEPPARVWACNAVGLFIDADWIVENACEEHHEEACEQISAGAMKALQDFLDAWCAECGVESWRPTAKAVILDPAEWEALKAERAEEVGDAR
jgi:hypothetical protein